MGYRRRHQNVLTPKRTNFFQQVVAIIHRHSKDEATAVTESEELPERPPE